MTEVPPLTGNRQLVIKFRPCKQALGESAEGVSAAAAVAVAAQASTNGGEVDSNNSGRCTNGPGSGALRPTAHAACDSHHAKGTSSGTSIRTGTSTINISGSEASLLPNPLSSDPSKRGGNASSKCGTSRTLLVSAAATQQWRQKDGSGGQSGDSLTCGPAITGLKPRVVPFQKESTTTCSSPSDRSPPDHAASNPLAPSMTSADTAATVNELLSAAAKSSSPRDLGPSGDAALSDLGDDVVHRDARWQAHRADQPDGGVPGRVVHDLRA